MICVWVVVLQAADVEVFVLEKRLFSDDDYKNSFGGTCEKLPTD